jgi:hypothetical protein
VPVDVPREAIKMADQGPLVRVDTDGKGNLLKLTEKEADAYIASHPGAKRVATPARTDPDAVPSLAVEGADAGGVVGLDHMTVVEMRAFARQRGLETSGNRTELKARLAESLANEPAEGATETPAEAPAGTPTVPGSENAPGA